MSPSLPFSFTNIWISPAVAESISSPRDHHCLGLHSALCVTWEIDVNLCGNPGVGIVCPLEIESCFCSGLSGVFDKQVNAEPAVSCVIPTVWWVERRGKLHNTLHFFLVWCLEGLWDLWMGMIARVPSFSPILKNLSSAFCLCPVHILLVLFGSIYPGVKLLYSFQPVWEQHFSS